jgi:hypothetical protein
VATSTVSKSPSFLVFPNLSPEYLWRVVATETNRTISRHKHLHTAVQKAELLNDRAAIPFMPEPQYAERAVFADLPYCSMWYPRNDGDADQCDNKGLIGDLETGLHMCVSCWKENL